MIKTTQRGFALTEVILSVLVIAILTLGAFQFFGTSQDSAKILNETKNGAALIAQVRSIYSGGNYIGLTTANMVNSNTLPTQMVVAGKVKNQWDGNIDFQNHGNTNFAIIYRTVPKSACVKLAMALENTYENVSIMSNTTAAITPATINANRVKTFPAAINKNLAITKCNAPANNFLLAFTRR